MEHPLPNGTRVLADLSCKHCNLGYSEKDDRIPNEIPDLIDDIKPTTIINHSIQDGVIRYKVTGVPISQHVLVEDIKEVLE